MQPSRRTDLGDAVVRRRVALAVALALAAALLGAVVPSTAVASCAAPQLRVGEPLTGSATTTATGARPTVGPGRTLVVTGEFFATACYDTGSSAGGCSAPAERVAPPATAVPLVLTSGSRSWDLGTADASGPESRYAIRWSARLPDDVPDGPARLTATVATTDGTALPSTLDVVVRRSP